MRRLLLRFLGVLAAGVLVCWRATLRVRVEDDPRPGLRAAGRRYVYAILHAQQLSFILLSDDVPILPMGSASRDGDWLVPLSPPPPSAPPTGGFRAPIDPRDFDDPASPHARAAAELLALEQAFDPDEAQYAGRESASGGCSSPSPPARHPDLTRLNRRLARSLR